MCGPRGFLRFKLQRVLAEREDILIVNVIAMGMTESPLQVKRHRETEKQRKEEKMSGNGDIYIALTE